MNLSDVAAKVAEKLRGSGAQTEVQKGNMKDFSEKVVFYNEQSAIAGRIVECVGDAVALSPSDGGVSYTLPNVFQIYLQGTFGGSSTGAKRK